MSITIAGNLKSTAKIQINIMGSTIGGVISMISNLVEIPPCKIGFSRRLGADFYTTHEKV